MGTLGLASGSHGDRSGGATALGPTSGGRDTGWLQRRPGEQLEHTEHLYGLRVKLLQSCPTPCDPLDHNSPTALSMGFSRQEYWSGLLSPTPEDLPDQRIEPTSLYI